MSSRTGQLLAAVSVVAVVASGCLPPWIHRDLALPVEAPAPGSTLVGCDAASTRLRVTGETHLDPSCTYTRGIDIAAGGTTLDCQGARVQRGPGLTDTTGIAIVAPRDASWSGITVRNCSVSGFDTNLRVRRQGAAQLPAGQEYDAGFSDVLVENSQFADATRDGVFLDWYVTGVTLRHIDVVGSAQVGVYIDPGATGNVVERSVIHRNGFGDILPEGRPMVVGGTEFRYLATGREGVALDGAWGNTIRDNWIAGNASGGVFLYKNCGEHSAVNLRRHGADTNLITGNLIGSEKVGVWAGSRMGENQVFMECADPAFVDGPLRRVHLDHARANTISDNLFWTVDDGIRIEDDDTQVVGNDFRSADPTDRAVVLGTRERAEVLGQPTAGTVLTANTAAIEGNPDPYQWVWPHVGTVDDANTSAGLPSALVPGDPPTIGPFLHVVDVWLP